MSDGFTQEVYAKCDEEEGAGDVASLNRFMLNGNESGSRFSGGLRNAPRCLIVVSHPLQPE